MYAFMFKPTLKKTPIVINTGIREVHVNFYQITLYDIKHVKSLPFENCSS